MADYLLVYFWTHGLVAGDVAGLGEPSLTLAIPKQPAELDDGLLTASLGPSENNGFELNDSAFGAASAHNKRPTGSSL